MTNNTPREACLEDLLDAYWEDVNIYERQREAFDHWQEQDEKENEPRTLNPEKSRPS